MLIKRRSHASHSTHHRHHRRSSMASSSPDPHPNTKNLRDHLLAALAGHPGTRTFHLHVLVTAPRKSNALFPFATPRPPRAYLHDVLVLLSEQSEATATALAKTSSTSSNANASQTGATSATTTTTSKSATSTTKNTPDTPDPPRILVSAIEVSVYHLPATSSAVLYVSKVDSTGQASAPSPTGTLVRALLGYYADPRTRPIDARHLWVQLFARAQAQYLFPNSQEWEGKKPLGDTKLCAWWKRVLGKVVADVEKAHEVKVADAGAGKDEEKGKEKEKIATRMYYVLPGYTQFEADNALRIAAPPSSSQPETSLRWEYGHPYSQKEIALPCPKDETTKNLGFYIPYFDDCPKSRFLDEIAHTTDGEIRSPQRKRARTMTSEEEKEKEKEKAEEKKEDNKPLGELGKVSANEFWERMSFRQECVAGAVTGFFAVVVSVPASMMRKATASPLAPQPGQVSSQLNKRVMTTLTTGVEFSSVERAVRATETVESAIRGLCEGIAAARAPPDDGRRTPERDVGRHLLAPPSTPKMRRVALPEVSPNPFPEPETSLETYEAFVYGRVSTRNAVEAVKTQGGGGHVTVLAVRRKKRI
ncbi:unnamed protein product [Cyclocybe aegerita]|uniref:histone acetyltransferase n=1 Tax=Cyclocybe aegerita TaxID=1973307 RepID=A0A8S0VU16_CYCAE|nr:unnamed protein product [Cyclocybe aegerita]